jgi:hypothetical protein
LGILWLHDVLTPITLLITVAVVTKLIPIIRKPSLNAKKGYNYLEKPKSDSQCSSLVFIVPTTKATGMAQEVQKMF